MNKLSSTLSERLDAADASDVLEVVVELQRPEGPTAAPAAGAQSRSAEIAARKEAFSQKMTPVEEAVRSLGGEVTGAAWINQTIRARVPACGVKELCQRQEVAAIDLPHPIKPDFG